MLYGCLELSSIELSNFVTINLENIDAMFFNCRALKALSEERQSIKEFKQTYHENALEKYLNLLGYMDASIEYILNTTDKQQKAVDRQKIENVFKNLSSKTAESVENSEISQEIDGSIIEPSIQNSDVKISEDMALDTL